MNKILIAVWGNPTGWKEVKYKYSNKEHIAKSPLPLIKDVENPDKIIIICVDTLSDDKIDKTNSLNYKDLKSTAEKIISEFCAENFGWKPDKIIVGYGFGEFNKTKFLGNPTDFYYQIFKELLYAFQEYISFERKEIEVVFDVSHGINFTVVLSLNALREILKILSYILDVKLKILNSDPFIGRKDSPDIELNINVIEYSQILPGLTAYKTQKRAVEFLDGKDAQQHYREIEDFKLSDEILVFLSSLIFATPIFTFNYLPDHSELRKKIDEICSKFEEFITISQASKTEIKRRLSFQVGFENLLKAYLFGWILDNLGFKKSNYAMLNQVKEFTDKIYDEKKFPIENYRIEKEIQKIEEIKSLLSNEYQVYANLIESKSGEQRSDKKLYTKEIDKRNFFAHAGFEYNTIKLRKNSNDEIEIILNDERNENKRKTIRKMAEELLTDSLTVKES